MSQAAQRTLKSQLDAVRSVLYLLNLPISGRGLFAQRPISAGERLFYEHPLLCTAHPSAITSSCYSCLKPLSTSPPPSSSSPASSSPVSFCSSQCEHISSPRWQLEKQCFSHLEPLREYCLDKGEKFPLLAMRLALETLSSNDHHSTTNNNTTTSTSNSIDESDKNKDIIVTQGNAREDLKELCYANIPEIPQSWQEAHSLLIEGLKPLDSPFIEHLDIDWYASVLSRLHLNIFRVDTVPLMDFSMSPTALLQAAAASISDAVNTNYQTGSAVYLLSSMLNHSCEPNLEPVFPKNNSMVGFEALTDIAANEQLTISYIDLELEVEQRRNGDSNGDSFARKDGWWQSMHQTMVKEVKEADAGKGFDVIFYGDSITESWRGTQKGGPCDRCSGIPQIFHDMFESKYRAAALAISGDMTQHLLYRLEHGELPEKNHPKAVVILIGTNDLGYAANPHFLTGKSKPDPKDRIDDIEAAAPEAAKRILQILHLLELKLPNTQILLVGLLPRGTVKKPPGLWKQPSAFTAAIDEINMHLKEYADADGRIHYVDCNADFLDKDGHILAEQMPDGLHPGESGSSSFAYCLQPKLDAIILGKNP